MNVISFHRGARPMPAKASPGPCETLAVIPKDHGNLPYVYVRTLDGVELVHPVSPAKAIAMARDLIAAAIPHLTVVPVSATQALKSLERLALLAPVNPPHA